MLAMAAIYRCNDKLSLNNFVEPQGEGQNVVYCSALINIAKYYRYNKK